MNSEKSFGPRTHDLDPLLRLIMRLAYFFRGWNSIGIRSNLQPNAGDATGAFYSTLSLTAKNQSRSSASAAYYRSIAGKRENYHLITGQSVTKINIDIKTMRATSVDVSKKIQLGTRKPSVDCLTISLLHGIPLVRLETMQQPHGK